MVPAARGINGIVDERSFVGLLGKESVLGGAPRRVGVTVEVFGGRRRSVGNVKPREKEEKAYAGEEE